MVHRILTSGPSEGALRLLRQSGSALLDVLLPPFCLSCGDRVRTADTLLCFTCLRAADRADAEDLHQRLVRLPAARAAIDEAFALWIFDKGGFLQHVHQALKYGNRPYYGLYLGRMLGSAIEQTFLRCPRPEVVVPVPLHRLRLYERGYNQSAYLARGLASVIDTPVDVTALARSRKTQSQTRLSRENRWQNLCDAFVVADPAPLLGRRVLLVDDILTTGATAGAAAASMKTAGAAAVDVAALALART